MRSIGMVLMLPALAALVAGVVLWTGWVDLSAVAAPTRLVQARRDGELYWIVSRGIRMTGMPAFGAGRSDREIWQLVAALRRLPRLTDADRAALHAGR